MFSGHVVGYIMLVLHWILIILIQQIAENIHQRFGPVDTIDMVMAPEAEPDI